MSALAFDTHAFVKRLVAAGMPEPQAEVLADQQSRLIDEKLATKADLAELDRNLRAEIAKTEAALRAGIRETELRLDAKIESKVEGAKSEIIKWMFGTIGFQTFVSLGAVAALARFAHP
jgi:hypothetical protein